MAVLKLQRREQKALTMKNNIPPLKNLGEMVSILNSYEKKPGISVKFLCILFVFNQK